MKYKKYYFSLISLIIGLYIYIVYRTDSTVVNHLLDFIFPHKKDITKILRVKLPIWAVYSLPEGLWIFSISIISRRVGFYIKGKFFSIVYIPIIFAISLELFQLVGITNGIFDLYDIIISILFWLIAIILPIKNRYFIVNKFPPVVYIIILYYALIILSDVY